MYQRLVLLGIASFVAFAIAWTSWSANAQSTTPAYSEEWEYKVLRFEGEVPTDAIGASFERRLNQHAKDGWQYAGPLTRYSLETQAEVNQSAISTTTWVALKRPAQ